MSKYYLSDSNSATDQSVAQSSSTDYAILMNQTQVRFFKSGNHKGNLNHGLSMDTNMKTSNLQSVAKTKFQSLGTAFTKFFSGDNPGGTSANNNAFAYMAANTNHNILPSWV